jgi:hypothetical protein
MVRNTEDLNLLAQELDRSGAYKTLTRFVPKVSWGSPEGEQDGEPVRLMVVNTEGFERDGRTWLCRLSYVVADFEPSSGLVWRVSGRYDALHDPRRPAPHGALEALGLAEHSLRGQFIDRARVESDLAQVSLVVSRRAAVDRPALEFFSSAFRHKHWACTSTLSWGGGSDDLEVLLMRRAGQFLAAATGLMRAEALLHLLAMRPEADGAGAVAPMLLQVLHAAKERSYRVWVDSRAFDRHSQVLVAAGFRPQRQEVDPRKSGPAVGWAKEVAGDLEQALAWLEGLGIRAGLVVDVVTGRERFTARYRNQMTPVYDVEDSVDGKSDQSHPAAHHPSRLVQGENRQRH